MLADKNKKASIDGLNQYFTVNEDITKESALKVETSIADKALGETLLTKINVKKAVDMIRKGQDKDPKRKSIEEKKILYLELPNIQSIMKKMKSILYHWVQNVKAVSSKTKMH